MVSNDSTSRPFDIVVRGVANPLPPRTAPESRSRWAVSPPGLEIRVGAPSGRYVISLSLESAIPAPAEDPEHGDPSTAPLRDPTDHEQLLLAAKFLSLPDPGDAVGNREAAEYATAVQPPDRPVTERAVDNCVARWSRTLQDLGVTGVGGRDNIKQLGRQLLAWGLLRQEDRNLLRPKRTQPPHSGQS